jgi:glycosyltransferase involved in cell wall biosynthesis
VITKNEEANLARCLASVRPVVREIVVVDSGSTDRTLEIARGFADRVITQPWLGYGRQKQFAVDRAGESWVLSIDADEALSGPLAREIGGLAFDRDGYELPRRSWYLGRWIAHGTWAPDPLLRLFHRDRARFTLSERVPFVVTGASGSLGSAVVESLRARGHRVRVFQRRQPSRPLEGVEYAFGNLGDERAVARAIAGADVVIHCGAAMRGGWLEHKGATVIGTRNVIAACRDSGVRQLVHVSSMSVIDWAGYSGVSPVTAWGVGASLTFRIGGSTPKVLGQTDGTGITGTVRTGAN